MNTAVVPEKRCGNCQYNWYGFCHGVPPVPVAFEEDIVPVRSAVEDADPACTLWSLGEDFKE